jgi:sarcosine oxidase subunit gamma
MTTQQLPRRVGPIHEQLAALKPRWTTFAEMPFAADFGNAAGEHEVAARLGLCDVSALQRMVVKGPGAYEFLLSRGFWVPDLVYGHFRQADGALIVRTGGAEFFVEDGWIGGRVESLRQAIVAGVAGVYAVPRQDVSLVISGSAALALFSETCSYNFRDSGFDFVMTGVAGVSCSILPRQLGVVRAWQLWADGTYGPYLWETLLEVARDLGGDVVGTDVMR